MNKEHSLYTDFSHAFDSVNHSILLFKLQHLQHTWHEWTYNVINKRSSSKCQKSMVMNDTITNQYPVYIQAPTWDQFCSFCYRIYSLFIQANIIVKNSHIKNINNIIMASTTYQSFLQLSVVLSQLVLECRNLHLQRLDDGVEQLIVFTLNIIFTLIFNTLYTIESQQDVNAMLGVRKRTQPIQSSRQL